MNWLDCESAYVWWQFTVGAEKFWGAIAQGREKE